MDFNGLLIGSEDPRRGLADYYTKLFGTPGWDDGGYIDWQLGSGGISIDARPGPRQERGAGSDHLEHRDHRREG